MRSENLKHNMKLHNGPFKSIKDGTKTIEMRLNDEKRQLINIGDIIEFENMVTHELISVSVCGLVRFNNFKGLYESFDKVSIGYKEDEEANYMDMEQYYSKDDIDKYGVLAILIKLI